MTQAQRASMHDDAPHPAEGNVTHLKPPHSLEAEQEVLGAVLVDERVFETISARLTGEDFYLERHQHIWLAMCSLRKRQVAIDFVTLCQELRDRGDFDRAGGTRTVSGVLDRSGITTNVGHYCAIIREKATRRALLLAAQRLEVAAFSTFDGELDAALVSVREAEADRIEMLRPTESWAQAGVEVLAELEPDSPPTRIVSSGIGPLDEYLPAGGYEGGWLIVLMAEPGLGKTVVALGNTSRACLEAGGRVLYVALSDAGKRRLYKRMLCGLSGVPQRALKRRDLTAQQHADLVSAANTLATWKLSVERLRTVAEIDARARAMKRREGLDLVVVDYLQRVRNGHRDMHADLAHTSSTLQDLAVDLDVPVLAISQPSTDKRRKGGNLKAADAKGSGAIEEDADLVIALMRGQHDKLAAGIEILKGRDVQARLWAPEDMVQQGRNVSACGWRWDMRAMRLEAR